ncbi:hypothetical protein [Ekhidna sp.]|uniref:hypothetical protein n=1 Tax=Ekhidna sp. TaxID=2608089 RepID=UPI0032EC68BE
MLKKFKELIENSSLEDLKSVWEQVEEMNLHGPSVSEFKMLLAGSSPPDIVPSENMNFNIANPEFFGVFCFL